jgi:hypothetical protein
MPSFPLSTDFVPMLSGQLKFQLQRSKHDNGSLSSIGVMLVQRSEAEYCSVRLSHPFFYLFLLLKFHQGDHSEHASETISASFDML